MFRLQKFMCKIVKPGIFFYFGSALFAAPPREIPHDLYHEYTMGNTIPVKDWYLDGSLPPSQAIIYKSDEIDQWITKVKRREVGYYGRTDTYLYSMLEKYKISGQNVGIVGSTIPLYESITLAYGGFPITIDYNKIATDDLRLNTMTVEEYDQLPIQFDSIISISSIEHDGLGRYGDPLNPWGDIQTMQKFKKMLKPGGLLFLAVPVGKDCLFWNAHRIYGRMRLPLLLEGWEIVDTCGFSLNDYEAVEYSGHQPVFVLRECQ